MRRPSFKVHEYKHSKTQRFYINLRAFGKGRQFFRTRSAAEKEVTRQKNLLEQAERYQKLEAAADENGKL